jgi:hypothetical protein
MYKRERLHSERLKGRHVNFQIEVAFALGLIFHVPGGAYGKSRGGAETWGGTSYNDEDDAWGHRGQRCGGGFWAD